MPYIRIDTNADQVAGWLTRLANRIPDAVLLSTTNSLAEEALDLYGKTYASWKHKPAFYKEAKVEHRKVEVIVGTNDQIYTYVDFGTAPHYIVAVDAPELEYPAIYHPATQPGILESSPASYEGPLVRRFWVWHTGAKARGFTEEIQKRLDKKAMRVFRGAVLRWIAGTAGRSGLGVIERFRRSIRH